ncbi:hypothetical protein Ddye_011715 [Dipteronia dyeriana]|uniref:Transposase MuDR plant domain-containing protein n=1 Tax=Dipteronia dyeriana TaxID=168575 RepID=A0AAD9X2Z4_9ROSI|nr:hypothetical protein Ddye_011715 [Dipteronia dyeriana]
MFGTEVIDAGQCDSDRISLISLIRATIEKLSGHDVVPKEDCLVWIHLPWCDERVEGGYQPLGWCDFEANMLNYDGDSEKDDDKDGEDGEDGECEGEGRQANEGQNRQYDRVPVFEEEYVDGDDGIMKEFMDLFEGYQSKSEDEYFSDLELEPEQVRIAKLVKGILFKKMVDGDIKFEVGQTFDNVEQMKELFREYVIQEGVTLIRVKNDLQRHTYKCKEAVCPWRAHGSCLLDGMTFKIKTLVDIYECHRIYNNKEAKVKWIPSKFENLMKGNPSISIKVISDMLREKYKVSVDIQRLHKAKKQALKGSKIGFPGRLQAFYWSGWMPLKRAIWIGATSAVALDANSGYCARHIYANFRLTYKGDHFKKLFWRASRNSNVFDFKETMDEIGAINPAAKSWLQEIEPKHWSRYAYDHVIRCDHVTNNMTEDFNSMIGTHRASSYLELLEFIRRMVMRKFQERKEECQQWNSVLPPRVNAKILKNSKQSRVLTIIAVGKMEYELLGPNEGYVVKIGEYSCQCGSWQGI